MILTESASAKVNLYLHVLGKREDGYHFLDSLVVFAEVADRLTATPASGLSLTVTGPFADGLVGATDNLVLRAARALTAHAMPTRTCLQCGAAVTLQKNLPVASGIGGGSADAAAALRLLCRLWGINPGPDPLRHIAQSLGADVPVCVLGRSARMSGIGETLAPAPTLPQAGMVLVNPGVALSTASIFRARTAAFSGPAALPDTWRDASALATTLRDTTRNDLQPAALRLAPVIGDVLDELTANPRCLLARMSGSGATCFGLYDSAAAATAAASRLARPGWWVWGGAIKGE